MVLGSKLLGAGAVFMPSSQQGQAYLKHRQVTFVLLIVSVAFIALGLIGREWRIGTLTLVALTQV